MYKKYILFFLIIFLTFVINQSFIQSLDWQFNFWPAILVFILFVFKEKTALVWAISVGYLLDHFSFLPFGLNLVTLFLMMVIVFILMKSILNNRSILSVFVLTIVATAFYNFFYFSSANFLIKMFDLQKLTNFSFSLFFWQILANLFLILIMFLVVQKFTNKLQSDLISQRYGN